MPYFRALYWHGDENESHSLMYMFLISKPSCTQHLAHQAVMLGSPREDIGR